MARATADAAPADVSGWRRVLWMKFFGICRPRGTANVPPCRWASKGGEASTLGGEGRGRRQRRERRDPTQRGLNGPSPDVSANALCGLAFTVLPPPYKSWRTTSRRRSQTFVYTFRVPLLLPLDEACGSSIFILFSLTRARRDGMGGPHSSGIFKRARKSGIIWFLKTKKINIVNNDLMNTTAKICSTFIL